MTRRGFFQCVVPRRGGPGLRLAGETVRDRYRENRSSGGEVQIVLFSDAGVRLETVRTMKVVKSDAEWRRQLSPLAFDVARRAQTERPFSGASWNLHEKGLFRCVVCDTALFSSAAKFDSGTGWPSFWQPIAAENVEDASVTCPDACRERGHVPAL